MNSLQLAIAVGMASTVFGAGIVVADVDAAPAAGAAATTKVVAARATPTKRAALNSVERHQADLADLSDRIWAYAETALRETRSAAALADYAEQQGFEVERGVAGMPTAFVATYGIRQAGDRRHGRVRRVARGFAEGESGPGSARGRGCRPRLRSQPVRRRQPRRGNRDQGADRGRQAQGHGEVLRHARRGSRRRQGLHGARRRVRRCRRRAGLAPVRRDRGRHGVEPGDGQPDRRVRGPYGACRGRPVERAQRGRRARAVHARHQHDARAHQADFAHALRDPRRRRRAERRRGLCEGLAVAARLEARPRSTGCSPARARSRRARPR